MSISNIKVLNKILDFKVTIIKTGIFVSLAAYWGKEYEHARRTAFKTAIKSRT